MIYIGDVHGKIDAYHKILQKHKTELSIQVGDFGFKVQHQWHIKNIDSSQHKICFGNHDDPNFRHSPHSYGDWHYDPIWELMTIRGAFSIDRIHRTENKDWWANEELTYSEMQQALDCYIENKPLTVVSHDCPHEVRERLFGVSDKSITSNGLQQMFESHQPALWIFGHWHRSVNEVINGTRFICLAELETFKL